MRDVKDTLGIKYNKYTSIYKLDNEKVGLLLKYLMWANGKEIILNDVSELTKKRIEKKSKEIEEQIEEMLEDEVFEIVFNEMTQQVKRSHKCWQQLKDNLESKKNDNTTTPTTPKEIPTKTPTETTTETEENENDYEFDEDNVLFYNDSLHQIEIVGFTAEEVAMFLYKNKERFDLPIKDISIVLNEMMSC